MEKKVWTFTELGYASGDWNKLPLKLRQRWWDETDFGANEPSEDLKAAIKEALDDLPKPAA